MSSVASIDPTFSDLSENGHSESFSQKKHKFFILTKNSPSKQQQGYQIFGFSRFLHHTLFD
jgi:hypothetical protein